MNRVRFPAALGILISPPLGFVLGIAIGLGLWFALADAGLPLWARLAISLMSVTTIPGVWWFFTIFLVAMPGAVPGAARLEEPAGYAEWRQEQALVWEARHETLAKVVAAPIRSVHAYGIAQEHAGVRITLIGLDLTDVAGCFSIQWAMTPDAAPFDELPLDIAVRVDDDRGSTYAVSPRCDDPAVGGGRGSIYFLPTPSDEVASLRLTIDRIFPLGRRAAIDGPWAFDAPLRPGSDEAAS